MCPPILKIFFLFACCAGLWLQAQEPSFSDFNGPISAALDNYEVLSGKHLIRDFNLTTVPSLIKINTEGMTPSQALQIYEATLLLNGVAIVPLTSETSKVISITQGGKNPRSEGVHLVANVADLPKADVIASYYMPLSYISATEASAIFTGQAPPHAQYGAYTPAPTAQALILTENTSTLRQLIALKELIDVPSARVTNEFIELHQADAEKVADLLNKLLTPSAVPGASPGGAAVVPPSVGTEAPLSNERNLLSGPAQIVADPRSNRLLIVTRPVNLPLIDRLVAELDRASQVDLPTKRQLKFVQASDILSALELAAAQTSDEYQHKNGTEAANAQRTPNTTATPASSSSSSSSSDQGADISSVIPALQDPNENNQPTISLVGKTRLLADNHSNSVLIFGPPDATHRVLDMIDQLDQKPQQVYLATVIGQLNVTKNTEFGIDILQKFRQVGNSSGIAGGQITRTSATVPEPNSLLSSTLFPLSTGLTLYGAIGSTIDAYVTALQATSRFKVISRPSVYTSNNKKAVIASGSQVPVPSNTTSGLSGTNNQLTTTSNIEYKNVVLELDVIPLINANRQVTLKIRQVNNTLGANRTISGNSVPTIDTQGINTEITVPDRSTIVIGGLITDSSQNNINGIPFLSDIPVLGYLFKDTVKNKSRDELIIMIQPTVIDSEAEERLANVNEEQRTVLGPEATIAASKTVGTTDQSTEKRAKEVISPTKQP